MDFHIENYRSFVVLQPLTQDATDWLTAHIGGAAQWYGGGLLVEPRYLGDIVDGIQDEGLTWEVAA